MTSTLTRDTELTVAPRPAPGAPGSPRPTRKPARSRVPTWRTPAALALLALAIRIRAPRGLWVDEAISVDQAHMSISDMLENLRTTDLHPPLHHLLLWVTERLIGTSEFAVRLPSLLAGVALVVVLYLAGREIYDRRTGLIAAAVCSVAPFTVWYAQEARMYGLLMLWSALAVWVGFRVARRNRWSDWLLLAVVSAAIVWTQYLGGLLVGTQQLGLGLLAIVPAIRTRKVTPALVRWMVSLALLVLLVAPLVPFGLDQLHGVSYQSLSGPVGTPAATVHHSGVGLYTIITNGVWAVFGYHADSTVALLVALWPAGVLGALCALGRGWSRRTFALIALVVVPVAGFVVLSLHHPDLFTIRYLSAVVPVVLLLLARLVARLASPGRPTAILLGVVMALLVVALIDQQFSPDNPRRYDDREAIHRIDRHATRADHIVYAPIYLREVVHYYAPHVPAGNSSDLRGLHSGRRVFVIGSFFDVPGTYAEVGTVLTHLEEHGLHVRQHWRFTNVQVWELA